MFVKPLHIHETLNIMVVNIMGFTVFELASIMTSKIATLLKILHLDSVILSICPLCCCSVKVKISYIRTIYCDFHQTIQCYVVNLFFNSVLICFIAENPLSHVTVKIGITNPMFASFTSSGWSGAVSSCTRDSRTPLLLNWLACISLNSSIWVQVLLCLLFDWSGKLEY